MRNPKVQMMTPKEAYQFLEFKDGLLYWRKDLRKSGIRSGSRAGYKNPTGYRYIRLLGVRYLEHRLAWFMVKGVWPEDELDHINRVKDDNRIENLRDANRLLNVYNTGMRTNNSTGFTGVQFFEKTKKWSAMIMTKGVVKHLGYFDTAEEASQMYQKAREVRDGNI